MSDINEAAMAISIADIQAHPAEAMAALIEMVLRQGELLRQQGDLLEWHEKRLDRYSERIDELQYREESKPMGEGQANRAEVLRALLAAHGGKMPAKEARQKMQLSESTFSRLLARMGEWIEVKELKTNRRAYLLVLKSKRG